MKSSQNKEAFVYTVNRCFRFITQCFTLNDGNDNFIDLWSVLQTKQKDIVVQDIKNQLYLISNQGVVRWKKKISAPIIGGVKQIDLFKISKF